MQVCGRAACKNQIPAESFEAPASILDSDALLTMDGVIYVMEENTADSGKTGALQKIREFAPQLYSELLASYPM